MMSGTRRSQSTGLLTLLSLDRDIRSYQLIMKGKLRPLDKKVKVSEASALVIAT
jgi:hypothetical protein